jgi:transposase
MTHDYKRHGTTTLFAALDVLEGKVIGQCMARHRHQEFIHFLNKINRETPAGRELHLIVDNYATHKHPKVLAWLDRHPRFHFHFTPISASWLNAVEGFFAKRRARWSARWRGGLRSALARGSSSGRRLSSDHFSVDGTLLEAGPAPRLPPEGRSGTPPSAGRDGARDFHGERPKNDTQA